jgi:hypothetical protein
MTPSRSLLSRHAHACVLLLPLGGLLAGCGGGGNESGPPDSIQVSPENVTVAGGPGSCASGPGPKIYVYGGTPPYTLANSGPSVMTIDRTSLQNSGDGFTLTFNGACIQSIPVTVQDDLGRLATVTVSNVIGS